jgi:peptidoglycan/xylan/chitin deacetylase (PgdA/CDA1 family)
LNLCFHGIGTPQRELEPEEAHYWIAPEQFDEMLEVIARDPAFRISFDDGNASDVEIALPALMRRGLTAEFFIVAARLEQPGSVSVDGLRELRRHGMTIGTHGMHHRPWRKLDEAGLREELIDARARLVDAAEAPVERAACPFGSYDRRVLAGLRRAGYTRAYTVDGGPARSGAWLQSRHTILDVDSPATLEGLADEGAGAAALRTAKQAVKRWR